MHGLLLVFCLMAVSMPTTAFLPVLPPKPPDKVSPAPTTCAAVSCVRGQECRFVTEGLHVAPRCLDSEEIPRGGSDACGKTGHPLLIAKETEEGTEYSVFRCKDLCPALHLLFVDGVCCAGVDTCDLPRDPGPCEAIFPRYYYDSVKQKCLKFNYGGCDGNQNNFKTLPECQKACQKAACDLPRDPGPCKALFPRYYYDSDKNKCLKFNYGGCAGNANNFKTLPECQKVCVKDKCKLPRDPGPCKALFPRYYYDSNEQKCLKFNYGGCAGNPNNFKTLPECQKACQGEGGICQLPKETGPCRAHFPRYYYDSAQKKCLRFVYGGCRGNKNNFKTLDECKKTCHKTPPPPVGSCPPVIPTRPGVCAFTCKADSDCKPGDKCCRTACGGRTCVRPVVKPPGCAAITCLKGTECIEDEAGARCKPIVTVGKCPPPGRFGICAFTCSGDSSCGKGKKCCKTACGGTMCKTAIPLPTCAATTCKKGTKCVEDDTTGARCEPIDICQLPRVTGPCRARLRRYYYDPKKQQCNRFYYGGCRGNKNNFRSKLACEKACQKPSVGICPPALPSPPGTCGQPCKEDRHCKKGEKCCKTGCGHKGCRPTVKPPTCASTLCIVGTICKETRKGAKCVKVKPGICPGIQKKKTCGRKCKHDEDCPKKQKCCNVGCKRNTCVNPLPPCAVVRCGHGLVCINTPTGGKCVPAGPRPGQCPKFKCAPFPPTCVHKCKQDSECPTGRKCCSSCTGCKDCLTSYALDPCAKKKCKKGEKCKLQVVQCIRAPCPPLPVCVPAEKPGACPNVTGPGICVSLCQNDQSCPGDQKCCSNGCGQVCMGPVPTCANKKCKIGQKCKLIDVLCIRAPCPSPIPTCVPAVTCATTLCIQGTICIDTEKGPRCVPFKPGKCPPPKCPLGLKPAPCRSQCQKDHDCPKFHKCCKGCGNCRECVKSILPPLCNSVKCGPGKECVLEEVVCITLPCNPLPVCVYKGRKAGQCPTPGPESKQNCKSSCQSDSQCKGADKCCPTTCGATHCSPTVPTSTCKDVKCPDKQKCRVLYDKRIQTAQCFARPPPLPHPDATCPNGFPLLLYPQPAAPIVAFCGRGPNRIQCPPTHYCKISPVDLFAVCCRRPTQGAQGPYCNPDCGVGERCDRHLILCGAFGGTCPPTPRCEDVCLLGRTPGVCKPVGQRYYYDSKARQCVAYVNGCPGTGNNFGSEQECKTQCYRHVCQLPKDPGPCKASIVRYYYDTKLGKCQSFIYGCQGNANNFQSLKDCSRACAKVKPGQCPRTGGRGLCVASGYCQQDRDCPGNKKCCETECNGAVCVDPQPTCADTECKPGTDCIENGGNPKCVSPKPGGCPHPPCAPPPPYPPKCLDKCKTDHDCPGNQKCCNACSPCKSCHTPFPPPPPTCSNKICKKGEKCVLKKVVCKRLPCHPQPVCIPASKHKCLLPKDPGPCKAAFTKYYYDSAKGKCSEFTYGGCKGNGNRFDSLDDCKKACSQHICKLPSITGMCRAYIPSYFYNTKTGKCERFIYGGCQGNDNRFPTEKECQDVCTPEE